MTRKVFSREGRGFAAIGIFGSKTEANIGTLFRTAQVYGCAYIFTVGRRYQPHAMDTGKSWRHMPLLGFPSFEAFREAIPREAMLIGVELCEGARPLERFFHPERAVYLLGAEDKGLPQYVLDGCHQVVRLPGCHSVNVAVAGSIVLYDRASKSERGAA